MSNRWLRFGEFDLDTETGDLVGPDGPVGLQPLPARVLAMVVSGNGTVVARGEITERLWGRRTFTADQALNTAIRQVRRALGDSATDPRFIATVPRRGYRLLVPVEATAEPRRRQAPSAHASLAARPRRWGRPVLAVTAGAALVVLLVGLGRPGGGSAASDTAPGSALTARLPADLRIEYAKARELLRAGQAGAWRDAARGFDRVREAEPDFLPATSGASLAALRLGEAERAAGLAAWALAADPAIAEAHMVLGSTLLQRGDWSAARSSLQRARALDPGLVPVYTGLAVLEALDGRLDSALALAGTAVDIEPVSAFTRADAGYAALWAGRPDLALAWCGHGRDVQPDSPTLAYCVLDAYHALGQGEREREVALSIMHRLGADTSAVASVADPPAADEGLARYRAWQRERLDPGGEEPPGLAGVLAYLHMQDGAIEDALRLLGVAAARDPGGTRLTLLDPAFEPVRRDARLPPSLRRESERP